MGELTFRVVVSDNATNELCGDCLFVEYEGAAFCRLFGCETLHVYPDRTIRRTAMCRHFERTGETVTIVDQQP